MTLTKKLQNYSKLANLVRVSRKSNLGMVTENQKSNLNLRFNTKKVFSNSREHVYFQIDTKTNEIYLLGDFSMNLLQNGKFILKEYQLYELKNPISASVNKYKHFNKHFH